MSTTPLIKGLTFGLISCMSLTLSAATASTETVAKVKLSTGAIYNQMAIHHPVWAANGMVASQEALATQIGVDIMKQGGNAIDAAVAVGYALAVTLPRAGNLGGGGFMLVYLADEQRAIAIDYREVAPLTAYPDMFLDDAGNPDSQLSRFHGLAVGVPGTVLGFELALNKYGSMSLAQVMAPAIKLARDGIVVTPDLANSLQATKKRLSQWPSTKTIFYKADGSNYQPGEILKQTDLANTLTAIAKKGSPAFYQGPIAKQISNSVRNAGGMMTMQDLATYEAIERRPVTGDYRGYQVISMPPPSSGGVHIIQMLNMLSQFPIDKMGHNSAATIHVMAESMRRAYADRSLYLGDPDFVNVPVSELTNEQYAKQLVSQINPNKATPSSEVSPGTLLPYESNQTTHYSVVDKFGNAVSNTYTLNFSYGSGLVANGTGVLLNNEMDDFSAKPGTPNAYGLIGGKANAVAAKKRPLSSMTPTIVLKDNKPYLVTGSPGGSRIITTTLQVIMNVIDHNMNIAEASAATRIHHQWLPDMIRIEKGLNVDTINLLENKGHKVEVKAAMGSTQTIMLTEEGVYGASDPRRPSALSLGY
ncbi:gamma-glutamyltransferase [Moritella viscosa]|uniref:Glutathione hydrolase proenzyme n=1 Tax=Moritella viscosa TaxID=80854 RepID=A0A090IIS2_9GAMM|nr:gamma-glutamyltransferase [Moritella viscosa]CED61042.1 gamma-glutamyltranspeptidase [Moritella viscosa]SGY95167.1 Gamma-glutamyltranspeptidase [Moritella viscosa]SGZ00473.1 Gamma-glutamyltranspeptidase [Moritella viscosa]SGZ06957.1 Gamma-glutamyltranspeptidase [Moritella viscosa]SGZ07127.1 Gamma-glutamyltranspeptidase [Moritella viscosa]